MNEIKFYSSKQPYFELSNFYGQINNKEYQLFIDGHYWQSTEHYYQAQKFLGKDSSPESIEYSQLVASTDTPNKAYVMAKQKQLNGYAVNWKHSKNCPSKINDLIKIYK